MIKTQNEKLIELYNEEFEKHGDSSASLFDPKNRSHERFNAVKRMMHRVLGDSVHNQVSILDYGCGLGHLENYLEHNFSVPFLYYGADINKNFITFKNQTSKKNYFELSQDFLSVNSDYDFIIAINVFNIITFSTVEIHQNYVQECMKYLFSKSNIGCYFSFLSPNVDFKQNNAFHPNISDMLNFCQQSLSRRIVLDHAFLPFEFGIFVYKNFELDDVRSVYKNDCF
jgi:SAM-dependent methyltransferase